VNSPNPHQASENEVRDQHDSLAADLARYSIRSIPTMIFEWGGYRYSNASDAIAAAKRGEAR
jgi:hypothetical protein